MHAAKKAGTFLGEAFMYRFHPQTLKLVELIKAGTVGEVRLIRSSFGFALPKLMHKEIDEHMDLGLHQMRGICLAAAPAQVTRFFEKENNDWAMRIFGNNSWNPARLSQ